MRADTTVLCLVQILRRSQHASHSRCGSLRSSACWNETRVTLSLRQNSVRNELVSDFCCLLCLLHSGTLFVSCISENLRNHRIHPRFFDRCDGGRAKPANRDQSRFEVSSFQRRLHLILVNKDRRTRIVFRKMMPPGTISLISVPELEELPSVSLPPMRAARSRIPCSPKCPSFPRSAMTGSIPVPLSPTRSARSCAYLSSTSKI